MKHNRLFMYQWCSDFCTCKFKHFSNLTKMFMLLCCLTQLAKDIMNCCVMTLMHQHLVPTKK